MSTFFVVIFPVDNANGEVEEEKEDEVSDLVQKNNEKGEEGVNNNGEEGGDRNGEEEIDGGKGEEEEISDLLQDILAEYEEEVSDKIQVLNIKEAVEHDAKKEGEIDAKKAHASLPSQDDISDLVDDVD